MSEELPPEGGDEEEPPDEDAGALEDYDEAKPGQLIIDDQNFWDDANVWQFEKDAAAEGQQFEEDGRRTQAETAALLRYIDPKMVDPDFVVPVFEDPHDAVTYIAGVVELRRTAQDTRHRQTLIWRVTTFTAVWILAVLAILGLVGTNVIQLPEAVTVTLVGTTTANVLGLAVIVLQGMFNQRPRDHVRAASRSAAELPPPE